MKTFWFLLSLVTGSFAITPRSPGMEKVKRDLLTSPLEVVSNTTSGCKYPSQEYILNVWEKLVDGDEVGFILNFSLDIDWTVMNTHPLAGHFDSLSLFLVNSQLRLYNCMASTPKYTIVNIVGGCESPWSITELLIEGTAKNGRVFDEIAVWSTKWNTEGKVVQVRSYVDSWATALVIHENEDWSSSSWRTDRTTYISGPNPVDLTEVASRFGGANTADLASLLSSNLSSTP